MAEENRQNKQTMSEQLTLLKDQSELTNEQIASLSGVPLGTVQKVFAGITKKPRAATVRALITSLSDYVESRKHPNRTKECADGMYVFKPAEEDGYGMCRLRRAEAAESYAANRNNPDSSSSGLHEDIIPYGSSQKRKQGASAGFVDGSLATTMKRQGDFTLEDYYALPEDRRYELIDGHLFELSAPKTIHQRILVRIGYALIDFITKEGGKCEVFLAPTDVRLDRDLWTMVQPDIIIVCNPDQVEEWGIEGAPDFLAEILSPATAKKDIYLKTVKYEKAGVREYWIVDPEEERIYVYGFEKNAVPCIYRFDETVPVGIYGGKLKICLRELLGPSRQVPDGHSS